MKKNFLLYYKYKKNINWKKNYRKKKKKYYAEIINTNNKYTQMADDIIYLLDRDVNILLFVKHVQFLLCNRIFRD